MDQLYLFGILGLLVHSLEVGVLVLELLVCSSMLVLELVVQA